MRARFTDPQGPTSWRMLPYVVPALLMLVACFGPGEAVIVGLAAIGIFNAIALLGLRQRTSRSAEIECGPGTVSIQRAGSRNQRIRAKDIIGATTARTRNGFLLTLQHRKREHPISIELEDETDVANVRHALGIGHGGFGTIAWRTQADNMMRAAFIGRMVACVVALVTLAFAIGDSSEAGVVAGMFFGQLGLIGAALGVIGMLARSADPSVVMAGDGLRLRTPRGWFALPYNAILHIEDHPRGLVFSVPQPYNSVAVERVGRVLGGPSEHDRKVLVSQILAAAQRARGLGPHKNDVTGRVDVLRRNRESARDWLVRLDMAGQMLSAGAGYRGNTLDADDLWTILEDPDAEADLRAAAARVLRHAPNTRLRIDAAVAAVRDESTNRRLRIAIQDDLDAASEQLTFLDATEPRARAMRSRSIDQG